MTTRILTDPEPEPDPDHYRHEGETMVAYIARMLATTRRYLGIDPGEPD